MPNWKNFWINLQSFQVHGAGVSAPFLALGLTELARAMVTPHCQIRQLFTASPCPNLWHMDSCRHASPEPLPGVPLSTLLCPLFLGIWNLFHNPFSCVSYRCPGALGLTSFSSRFKCHRSHLPERASFLSFWSNRPSLFLPWQKGQGQQDGSPTLIPLAQGNSSHGDLYSGKAESSRQQKWILGQDKEEPSGFRRCSTDNSACSKCKQGH